MSIANRETDGGPITGHDVFFSIKIQAGVPRIARGVGNEEVEKLGFELANKVPRS